MLDFSEIATEIKSNFTCDVAITRKNIFGQNL